MPSFDRLILNTPRLTLRPLSGSDAEALYAMFSDPAVMKYWSTAAWTTLEPARELIVEDTEALRTGRHLRLGIQTRADHRLIGTCSLFSFNHQCKRAEIGYCLARSAWKSGFMHEALCALIDYAFDDLGLHRIEADTDPRNLSSVKFLERLGFVKEGHLRERWIVEGQVSDSSLYGLLRHEWLAKKIENRRRPT